MEKARLHLRGGVQEYSRCYISMLNFKTIIAFLKTPKTKKKAQIFSPTRDAGGPRAAFGL